MNKTQAIQAARENVGPITKLGNNYRFNYFDSKKNVWRESTLKNYHQTLFQRSQELIYQAMAALTESEDHAIAATGSYFGGRWEKYINFQ